MESGKPISSAADLSPQQEAFLCAAWSSLTKPHHHFYIATASHSANQSPQQAGAIVAELIAADVLFKATPDGRIRLTPHKGEVICRALKPLVEQRDQRMEHAKEMKLIWKGAIIGAAITAAISIPITILCAWLAWKFHWK